MKSLWLTTPCFSLLFTVTSLAASYRLEVLNEGPPKDELSAEIYSQLPETGLRIIRGTKTPYCDLWFCKDLAVAADFEPNATILYPLQQGQLVGVALFHRDISDLRDQEIAEGMHTMRYALQPIDGSHVGTFPTRDFLVLIRSDGDASPGLMDDEEELNELSSEAAESSHPAMWAMLQFSGEYSGKPELRNDEDEEWWILRVRASAKAGDAAKNLDLELVVVGIVEE